MPPGATVRVAFWTLVAPSRERSARPGRQAPRPDARSSARSRWRGRRRRCSCITSASSPTRRICSSVSPTASSTPTRRCGRRPTCSSATSGGPSALWAHGISGDLPIVLVRIDDADDLEIVRQLLRAHEYWRMKRLAVDLVILNEQPHVLRAGPAGRARSTGAREPVAARSPSARRTQRRRLRPARRSALARGPQPAADRGARRARSAAAAASPSRSSACRAAAAAVAPSAGATVPGREHESRDRTVPPPRQPSSSSSTASAASPTTAAST